MPTPPKLLDEQWAEVRERWESDPRKGYTWLVADMSLGVTRAAVRNKALKEGWRKKGRMLPRSVGNVSCCRCCCIHHKHLENSERSDNAHYMEQLLRALDAVENDIRQLRETLKQRNHL